MIAPRMTIVITAASIAALVVGCDHFEPPPSGAPSAADKARADAKAAMKAVVDAAAACTSSCVAAELRWEADEALPTSVAGEGSRYVVPEITHYSRPCIPERCAPKPADLDRLRGAARALKDRVDASPDLRVPTYQGFAAMAEAMVGFSAAATGPKSGLSMHYTSLASAYRAAFPGEEVPLHPPSLVASLAGPEPGGDPCKGWRIAKFCDVRAVRVPKEIRWRTDPPCVEVTPVPK